VGIARHLLCRAAKPEWRTPQWCFALLVVLLAVLTGPSSATVSPSDASGSHGLVRAACGSDAFLVYLGNLSSSQPPCEAASRAAAARPGDTMPSSTEVSSSDAPESDIAAAAPTTLGRGSNELVAYQPNPSPGGNLTSEDAPKTAASPGHTISSSEAALSDASRSDPSTPAALSTPARVSDELLFIQPNPGSEPAPRTAAEIAEARAYLIETASPGYTMTLQGPEVAIGRLHPEFAVRLESAIREARSAGLPFAGVFSAYRPPAFGIGGFSDKFNSLHTYGLAVDMHGIGNPGSPEAQLWHQIAAKNGVVCPYGPRARTEWNHCQPTSVKIILSENPLRETVTADGPISLQGMFEVGYSVIAGSSSVGGPTDDPPAHSVMGQRITAPAKIRTAYERRRPQTYRSIFDSRVKKSSRLYVDNWPKGVPRIANLDDEPRRPKSSATSRTLLKPIVMPRMIVPTARPKVIGARQAGPGST
jgi:hypothetical protein